MSVVLKEQQQQLSIQSGFMNIGVGRAFYLSISNMWTRAMYVGDPSEQAGD